MFQLSRIVGIVSKINPIKPLGRGFGVLSCSSKAFCRCSKCIRNMRHGFNCGCSRCYSSSSGSSDVKSDESGTKSEPSDSILSEKDAKINQLQDSYLRCLADMENLRQRTKKEVESASTFAIQKFCKDIVGVADVLELALGSVKNDPRTAKLLRGVEEALEEPDTPEDSIDSETLLSQEELSHRLKDLAVGLSMTLSELTKVFSRHGVTPIDPLHQKFDPNYHLALYEVPNGDLEAGTVVAVQKKGYLLNHRVVRPAAVGVSKKP